MTGILPVTAIPGWPTPVAGVLETLQAQFGAVEISPEGLHVSDTASVQAFFNAYVGSATQLAWNKNAVLAQLADLYLGKYSAGFNYTGGDGIKRAFQIDPQSQFNIDVQANASLGAIINGEAWDANSYFIAADNSHMPTPTAQAMRAFALAARGYVQALILRNRTLKDAVNAAADMATLDGIDISVGWPNNP